MTWSRSKDEAGTVLLVALLFLTIGSLLVVALSNLSSSNLLNTTALQAQRNMEYAADAGLAGAIQSVRYHGACQDFPKSGSIQEAGYNVFVSCTGTPIFNVKVSGKTLTLVSGSTATAFVPEDVGLQVYDPQIPNGGFAKVTQYVSATQLSIDTAATATDTAAIVGTPFQRLDLFSACASTGSISSCSPGDAIVSAAVIFYDTDNQGEPAAGYNLTINRWNVNTARG